MSKAPWFPWYPSDCDTDEFVRLMNDAELGFFMRCLNHSWLNDGLPGDVEEIARALRTNKSMAAKMWVRVGPAWHLDAGRFRNRKQESCRSSINATSQKRSEAAECRWNANASDLSNANADANAGDTRARASECEYDSASVSSGGSVEGGAFELQSMPVPNGNGYHPEWFEQWWSIYWRKVSRKPAEKAFRAHVKTEARFAEVMAATRKQTATMMARESDHRPHGATWLNAERWQDEPSLPARASPAGPAYSANAVDYPELPRMKTK